MVAGRGIAESDLPNGTVFADKPVLLTQLSILDPVFEKIRGRTLRIS